MPTSAPTTKWENVYEFAEWPSLFAAACRLTSSWVRKMRDRDSHAFFAVLKTENAYLVIPTNEELMIAQDTAALTR